MIPHTMRELGPFKMKLWILIIPNHPQNHAIARYK